LLIVYGQPGVNIRSVPTQCQREWLRLLTSSLQNLVSQANQQIKRTKEQLKLPDANGILLLANDGSLSVKPYDLVVLVGHILKKSHPDGSQQYSSECRRIFFREFTDYVCLSADPGVLVVQRSATFQ